MEKEDQMGCPHCAISGSLNVRGNGKCVSCNGTGSIGSSTHPCQVCEGSGSCRICGGSGWISNKKSVE